MTAQKFRHFIRLFLKLAFVTICLLISPIVFADKSPTTFPTMPGFTLIGLTGENTIGYADAMLPLFGQPARFFYLDPQGLFHNNDNYTGSLGGGLRYLYQSTGILGAYVFGDYNNSPNGNSFWFVSPGVEFLSKMIDFSANLYIPISSQRKNLNSTLAETVGVYDYISFSQHSQFDRVLNTFESVGTGGDVEIGFRAPMKINPKVYVGGYYFNPKDADNNIKGVTARLEVPLTDRVTLIASEAYDNMEHNTVKIGASFNFGGRKSGKNFKDDLAERMVDPIHRNLIAISGSAKTAQPIVQTDLKPEEKVLTKDHIAFFNASAYAGGDGTFERPFNVFNQANIDTANLGNNRNFYVNTGTYVDPQAAMVLTNDNLYGRQSFNTSPFVQPAEGMNRPLFKFSSPSGQIAFTLVGDSVVDSVRLDGSPLAPESPFAGISIENPVNKNMSFLINNSEISHYYYGLFATNSGNLLNVSVNNTLFHENGAAGINGVNGSANGILNMSVDHSIFNNTKDDGLIIFSAGSIVNLAVNQCTFNGNSDGLDATNHFAGHFNLSVNQSTFSNNRNGLALGNHNSATLNLIADQSIFIENHQYGVHGENSSLDPNQVHITLNQPVFSRNGVADTNKDHPSGANIIWVINN